MSSARKRRDTEDAHLWMREARDKLATAKEYSDPAARRRPAHHHRRDKLATAKEYSDQNPALNTRSAPREWRASSAWGTHSAVGAITAFTASSVASSASA